MLKIYATPLSANGRKVLAVSRELGLNAEIHIVNVYRGEGRTAEYLAINPTGKIPTLVDGDFTLFESNAILIYLAEGLGKNRLWSTDPKPRGRIAQWLFWESAHWQPSLIALLSEQVGHRLLPQVIPRPGSVPDWNSASLQPLLKRLEIALSADLFLTGAQPTIADFSVAGMCTYFRVAGFPFNQFPAVDRWYAQIEELESWRATESALWSEQGAGEVTGE
jgi:glutathione S-transferase